MVALQQARTVGSPSPAGRLIVLRVVLMAVRGALLFCGSFLMAVRGASWFYGSIEIGCGAVLRGVGLDKPGSFGSLLGSRLHSCGRRRRHARLVRRFTRLRKPSLDLFAHVLAAGLVAEGVARVPIPRKLGSGTGPRLGRLCITFFLGSVSHLALDLSPHFGFLAHIAVWTSLPYGWIVRPIVGGLVALAFVLLHAGQNRLVASFACAGAIYPDVEKLAHTSGFFPWPLFRAHAEVADTYTAGLPIRALAATEILLCVLFVVAYLRLVAHREKLARS